jgi:hypothetical protein
MSMGSGFLSFTIQSNASATELLLMSHNFTCIIMVYWTDPTSKRGKIQRREINKQYAKLVCCLPFGRRKNACSDEIRVRCRSGFFDGGGQLPQADEHFDLHEGARLVVD